MDVKSIGKNIRTRRLERSWSQEELAEKVGLSPVYIGMIERGEKIPKLETFINIINILEVSSDEVLMDVLKVGYIIRMSKYTEKIGKLDKNDQARIYGIIEAFLNMED